MFDGNVSELKPKPIGIALRTVTPIGYVYFVWERHPDLVEWQFHVDLDCQNCGETHEADLDSVSDIAGSDMLDAIGKMAAFAQAFEERQTEQIEGMYMLPPADEDR